MHFRRILAQYLSILAAGTGSRRLQKRPATSSGATRQSFHSLDGRRSISKCRSNVRVCPKLSVSRGRGSSAPPPQFRRRLVLLLRARRRPRSRGVGRYSRFSCDPTRAGRRASCPCADRSGSPLFGAASVSRNVWIQAHLAIHSARSSAYCRVVRLQLNPRRPVNR
jgi:hypothetical protein